MNEFGSFDVDSLLLGNDVSIHSLINGCVCCDLNNDLVNQLKQLIDQTDTSHILIEETGLAHPFEIYSACQDPTIIKMFMNQQLLVL